MIGPSVWARVRRVVHYLVQLEPVAVQAVVRAVFVLVAAVGVTVPEWLEPRIAAVVVAAYALLEVLTTLRARAKVTPDARVVEEVRPDGVVVAGPASELPTGHVVRQWGDVDPTDHL